MRYLDAKTLAELFMKPYKSQPRLKSITEITGQFGCLRRPWRRFGWETDIYRNDNYVLTHTGHLTLDLNYFALVTGSC